MAANAIALVLPGVRPVTASRMLVDFSLIEKARGGDSAAFNQVVLAYRKRIMGTISRLIGRPEDVEDVAQEVFVRLFFSLEQLRTPEGIHPKKGEGGLYSLEVPNVPGTVYFRFNDKYAYITLRNEKADGVLNGVDAVEKVAPLRECKQLSDSANGGPRSKR